jgi:hypothetical protein
MRKIVSCWMFRFSRDVVAEIVSRSLTATSPRYSAIKELDRRIRESILSPQKMNEIRGGPGIDPRSLPLALTMLTYMLSVIGDVSKSMPFAMQSLLELSKTSSAPIPSSKLFCSSPHRRS